MACYGAASSFALYRQSHEAFRRACRYRPTQSIRGCKCSYKIKCVQLSVNRRLIFSSERSAGRSTDSLYRSKTVRFISILKI